MDRPTDLHILSQSELFRELSPDILDEARAAALRRRLAKGEALFRQEEEATTVYIVVAGRLRVTQTTAGGQQILIRYVGTGETAGYSAVSGSEAYNSTVVAVDDSVLMAWRRERFRELMSRHGQIAVNALSVIESRYQEIQTRLRELATETVERRIALTLLRLVRQAGRRTAAGLEVAFPISRQDLAEMAGTTLHTVSRTMSVWEGDGIVASGRRRVVVQSPEALSAIAGVEPGQGGDPQR
jgi:CRP/FNR family transcriptional regulator, nitrogen oxide reductase regulator